MKAASAEPDEREALEGVDSAPPPDTSKNRGTMSIWT